MQALGIFFEAKIRFLLDWIKEDNVGPALAAVITIVGVIIIGVSWVQTIRESRLISRAREIVGNRNNEEFARDFNTISQDLGAIPKIQIAWNEFSETLIAPTFDDNRRMTQPCSNTQRPQAYFNLRELEIGPDFAKVFPSVFVGIGLSLTFLGLISALGEAVNAISASSGDTTSMQSAISNLLKISSAKFYASLFALFMSVVMTIALRLMTWKLAGALQGLNRSIERVVRFLTPEQLSLEANDLMRNQLGQLQIFNTDLAMKIGEQVQSSLNQSLAPVIQKLDSMGGDLTQQNIDSIRAISDEVSRSIQGATAGSMDRVAATLDNISEKLGRLSETLSGALSSFDTEFRQMLEGLKNSLQESTKGVADGIGQSMNQMASGIGETATEVNKIINGLTTTVSSLATAGAEISKQGGEELKRQVEAATQIASEQMAQAGRELSAGFKESTEGLVSALSAATSQLTRLEASLLGLPLSLDAVNTRLGVSATQVGEASNQFGIASSGIRSMVEPLAQYAADTREAITAVTQVMQDVSTKVGQSSEAINSAVASLDTAISAKLAQLEKGDEQLATLLTGIEESTERVLTKVNEFVTEVDRGFSLSVTKLNDSINEFEEVVNNLSQAIANSR
jgi:archaellum component FlaC